MIRTLAIAVTGLGLALAGASGASAADPVRIGFSLPLTGIFAPAAPSQKNAYELWRDQVNASGGLDVAGTKRPVEFVMYDDQSDPGQGAKIYEKLIVEDKVDLLLGPWGTPHHVAVAGVLERHKFPMVGDTAASVILRGMKPGYIWFPTSALPDEMGKQLPLLLKSQGVKTVAITTAQHPFSLENKKFIVEGTQGQRHPGGIRCRISARYPRYDGTDYCRKGVQSGCRTVAFDDRQFSALHAAIEGIGFQAQSAVHAGRPCRDVFHQDLWRSARGPPDHGPLDPVTKDLAEGPAVL